jgi:ribosomal protein S27AE
VALPIGGRETHESLEMVAQDTLEIAMKMNDTNRGETAEGEHRCPVCGRAVVLAGKAAVTFQTLACPQCGAAIFLAGEEYEDGAAYWLVAGEAPPLVEDDDIDGDLTFSSRDN